MKQFAPPVFLCALLMGGCSDPKEASKDNFKTAISGWIEKHPPCIALPRGQVMPAQVSDASFPRYVDASPSTSKFTQQSRDRAEAPFVALVDAGLLTVKDARIQIKAGLFGDGLKEIPVHAYDLSDAGKKAVVTEGEKAAVSAATPQFCYGTPTVDEILQYTEPGEAMGVKVSQVTYRYHLRDMPAWAGNARLKAAYPELERNTAESLDGKAAVILTNDGWVHERSSGLR